MKSILLRLYPPSWRARYREEFLDLLEQRPLTPSDVLDILLSALDARRRERTGWRSGAVTEARSGRRWGLLAMAGGILYPLGLLLAVVDTSGRPWRVPDIFGIDTMAWPDGFAMVLGGALVLIAMAALGDAVSRRHSKLLWLAVGLAALTWLGMAVTLAVMAAFPAYEPAGGPYYRFEFLVARQFWAQAVIVNPASTLLFAWALLRSGSRHMPGARMLFASSAILLVAWFHQVVPEPVWIHEAWWAGVYFFAIALSGVAWARLGWSADHQRSAVAGPPETNRDHTFAD